MTRLLWSCQLIFKLRTRERCKRIGSDSTRFLCLHAFQIWSCGYTQEGCRKSSGHDQIRVWSHDKRLHISAQYHAQLWLRKWTHPGYNAPVFLALSHCDVIVMDKSFFICFCFFSCDSVLTHAHDDELKVSGITRKENDLRLRFPKQTPKNTQSAILDSSDSAAFWKHKPSQDRAICLENDCSSWVASLAPCETRIEILKHSAHEEMLSNKQDQKITASCLP